MLGVSGYKGLSFCVYSTSLHKFMHADASEYLDEWECVCFQLKDYEDEDAKDGCDID